MAYIGKTPQVGNYVKLDAITCSSTNTYNLTQDSVAFTPESALHMMVSLNGVIQAPLTSFSVSGSTITFLPSSGTLSSSDTIDFILVLGNVLDIGTPSDSTVTNAKTNFVSTSSASGLQIKGDNTTAGTLQLNCEQNSHGIKLRSPAHTHNQSYTLTFPTTAPVADKALITDGSGNLSFGSAGGLTLLLNATISSAVSEYDIDSTYINSTYDQYILLFNFKVSSDNSTLRMRTIVGGTPQTGTIHAYEGASTSGSTYISSNAFDQYVMTVYGIGNSTGESVFGRLNLQNVNSTTFPFFFSGYTMANNQHGNPEGTTMTGTLTPANVDKVVNGLRFFPNTGNIASGTVKLYGIV